MSERKRLVLWRHGQTIWNAENRYQGQSDIPLNDAGVAQAERAARLLAALKPDKIFSSDLSRAASTAGALARITGLPVSLDKDLRERSGGCWEGLTGEEIWKGWPKERAAWNPPDGETAAAVGERVSGALARIADGLGEGQLAVVATHGAAIRLGLERFLGLDEEHSGILGTLSNCSWSVVGLRHGTWRLLEHNAGNLPEPVLGDDAVPG
ncbi:MAG: histidine phosphatase family protein [Nocardiopsaceae bacterium]|nr:histidine phosphatase family protein [Nocardiopsaceae bacterium]